MTIGPPPAPAPVTISALPSAVRSAADTFTPPLNVSSKARNDDSRSPVVPSNVRTTGPPPAPAPVTMSPRPSPFTSPTATRTPPANVSSNAKKSRTTAPDVPSNAWTRGPPPWSAATTMSAWRSPLISPTARLAPPSNPSRAVNSRMRFPVLPSNSLIADAPPAPGAVTTSGVPSWLKSAVATRTPPVNDSAYAKKSATTSPELWSMMVTRGPPPASAPTARIELAGTSRASNVSRPIRARGRAVFSAGERRPERLRADIGGFLGCRSHGAWTRKLRRDDP